jgi:hypothetical protein
MEQYHDEVARDVVEEFIALYRYQPVAIALETATQG